MSLKSIIINSYDHSNVYDLLTCRLCEMKALRNAEKSGARVRHLEAVMAESEKAFSKLEQDLVQVTKVHESMYTCMY